MSDEEAAEGGKKGKKGKKKDKGDGGGKSNLVPAIILAVGFVLGGRMMGGGGGGQAAAAPTDAAKAEAAYAAEHSSKEELDCAKDDIKKPKTEGAVYKLEPITVNLKDDHYLKVGIALVLDKSKDKKKFEEEGSAAIALDPTIEVLGGRSKEEFESNRAIQAAKDEITELVRPMFECKVIDVKFTEFVVQ